MSSNYTQYLTAKRWCDLKVQGPQGATGFQGTTGLIGATGANGVTGSVPLPNHQLPRIPLPYQYKQVSLISSSLSPSIWLVGYRSSGVTVT